MRSLRLLHVSLAGAALLATACGSDAATPATTVPTDTPAPTAATPTETPTAQPSPPPTPAEVTTPLHVVDLTTGADRPLMVDAYGSFGWSPDGTRIAAGSGAELAITDVDTGRAQIWMLNAATNPEWSADSRYVAVAGPDALLVIDTESRETALTMERDTSEPSIGWTYDWAPDGTLAAASLGGPVRIWDGQQVQRLDTIAFRLWWLDDGRLAVLEARSEKGPGQLTVRDPKNDYTVESAVATEGDLYNYSVDPSGRLGVEVHDEQWPEVKLRTVDLRTGSAMAEIVAMPITPVEPSLFRPGTDSFLVHTNYCTGADGLAVANPDGDVVTIADAFAFAAGFSPDGTQVAYTTATELWVVSAAGGTPRLLAEGVHGPAGFAWSLDGTMIAYAPYFGGFGACE